LPFNPAYKETLMIRNEFLASEILAHGAYLCLRAADGGDVRRAGAPHIPGLAARLRLENEFTPAAPPARQSIAFIRRHGATPGDIADPGVLQADWVIHVASPQADVVEEFCGEAEKQVASAATVRILRGVVQPKNYTGAAMNNWAYAHAVVQQPGPAMPNAFLFPMSKTAEWWRKDWMERHTYFLPRYDDQGRMVNEGHALASAAGIACLLRRTYRSQAQPAPEGDYDFVTYFECADADVPTFHQVCAALRDVKKNPEWRFVREGPTWQGRRVASWEDLFT
jgi:hypothetical protein